VVAWGGRTVAKRALGANHASRAPESGWPLPFHEVSGLGGLGGFDCSCSRASFQGNRQYHAHRRGAFFVEAKVAVGKNKATKASKATPAIDNCKGRVQRKVLVERGARFRCFNRCLHRKGAPDGKPTPNAETWESRSALATRHERQPCRLFPRQANQRPILRKLG
jgi:hypothetical protein